MNFKNDATLVAMSGGVDSAVAAYLTTKKKAVAGGVTMQLLTDGIGCSNSVNEDISGAAAVCRELNIPHFVAELGDVFRQTVIEPFVNEYEAGRTPNPCIFCNKAVKFGALLHFALEHGYDKIATGHYVRSERTESGRTLLRSAADASKDQTYMLWSLTQNTLNKCEFPLGNLCKAETRAIAAELGFPQATRRDSQDICFIPDGDYAAFIERFTGKASEKGRFIDKNGNMLGEHRGQLHYTIGQRKGLGIALGKPAFVTAKSAEQNTVTLGETDDLLTTRVIAKSINLIPFDRIEAPMRLTAKVRYRQTASYARVEQIDAHTLMAEFEAPQRAVCAGQSLVLYDGDYVIGGGIIC